MIDGIWHGLGGATETAKLAGLTAGWAIDNNELRSKNYRMNNSKAQVLTEDLLLFHFEMPNLLGRFTANHSPILSLVHLKHNRRP
jgi:hypothetical protein